MAQSFYTIDLQDTFFPMLSEQQGRTVIGSEAGKAPSKENRPGIAYCHNVMPSKHGYDSIGYLSVIGAAATLNPAAVFVDVRIAYGDAKSRLYLAWANNGIAYVLLQGSTTWLELPATVPPTGFPLYSPEIVTIGTVNGVSYIFFSGIGAFTFNEVTNSLDAVTLTGLTIADVLGVVATNGYLIAYTDQAIAWSSTIDPTDFVPSSVTGAGGGNVAGTEGAIIFCTSNSLGVLVYTTANTIAGTYTGNTQFPFKFRPVDDSKGGVSLDLVAYEAKGPKQFVYSKSGLQSITSQRAEAIIPEVTDFLAGKRFEDYDEVTKLYTYINLIDTMRKKIKFIASRYLVISYGVPPNSSFTHALVYDTALNKIGKLKLDHVDVFEYIGNQTEIAKESLAFLLTTGEVKTLDFSTPGVSSGVLILGKIQASRTRFLTLLGVELENIASPSDTLSVSSQVTIDGKNFTTTEGTLKDSDTNYREYVFRVTGKNHSLAFIGKFNLVTVLVRYFSAGRR